MKPPTRLKAILLSLLVVIIWSTSTFVLLNYTLQTLTAMESSILNGTMLVFISILSWIFLNETQSTQAIIGLILAFIGAIIVNIRIERQNHLPM